MSKRGKNVMTSPFMNSEKLLKDRKFNNKTAEIKKENSSDIFLRKNKKFTIINSNSSNEEGFGLSSESKNHNSKKSFINLLFKKINIGGGDIIQAIKLIRTKNYIVSQEYDTKFNILR